jgi:ethanolamine transporter EutH
MKSLWPTVASSAVMAAAVGILGMLPAGDALAQTRPALVRDVDQPARQPVVIRKFTSTSSFDAVYTVPAGKRFVLEHMSCTSLDDQLYAGIFLGSLTHSNIVYSVPVINTSGTVLVADGATRIYFEPGIVLNLRIFANEPTTCTLSGHTMDVGA